jgi:K+-transporting ATPase ATPase A chain
MVTILGYLVVLVVLTPPVGAYMYRVYTRERIGRVEGVIYRLIGVDPMAEQSWRRYASTCLWFSAVMMIGLYALLRLQGHAGLDPAGLPGVDPNVSFNTAASFVSNTNWQTYGGESTMSYLSQMLGLTFQQFVSAAVGMAVLVALFRGFTRSERDEIGNFWKDTVRGVLYILLPLSILLALALVAGGVVQTLKGPLSLEGIQGFGQTIARGPAASMIAIKQLGTNGGGFFNVNSTHPLEAGGTPTMLLELLSILLIPSALTYTFGKWVGNARQGWALLAVMLLLFIGGLAITVPQERVASSAMVAAGIPASAPNLEGKELRNGTDNSSLWAVATTAASNGSVNSMHDSYRPLGQVAPMANMATGEVIFGGVGSGLYGMLFYAITAVFMGGLMVGRTPEYLGKKIGAREIKYVALAILVPFVVVLGLTAVAVVLPSVLAARGNEGPHGFSEILYAYLSQGNNNGSAFAGLTGSGTFLAVTGGIAMLVSRFVPLIAALALAGVLGRAKVTQESAGTLRTDTPLFVVLLTAVILVIGALTFLPALALGPVVEHLMPGRLFP